MFIAHHQTIGAAGRGAWPWRRGRQLQAGEQHVAPGEAMPQLAVEIGQAGVVKRREDQPAEKPAEKKS